MDWKNFVEEYFYGLGFRTEWVWVDRDTFFLLAWKGRQMLIHCVDLRGRIRGLGTSAVKNLFFGLLQHLKPLEGWGEIIRGRTMVFRWMAPGELGADSRMVLEKAGVEPFYLKEEWMNPGLN